MLGFYALGEQALGAENTNEVLVSAAAAFTLTGHDVGLYANRVLIAEVGAFTLTVFSAELARGRVGLNVRGGGGARGLMASSGGGARGLRIRA